MELHWERIENSGDYSDFGTYRSKVPGGWLILIIEEDGTSITFLPDPTHNWNGNSLS